MSLNLVAILKCGSTGFADGLDMVCERRELKRGVIDDSNVSNPSN